LSSTEPKGRYHSLIDDEGDGDIITWCFILFDTTPDLFD